MSSTQSRDDRPSEAALLERLPALESVIGELVDLADEGLPAQDFLRRTMEIIGRGLRVVHAEIEVRHGATLIRESYSAESADSGFWEPTIQSLLTDTVSAGQPLARIYRSKNRDLRIALFSTPIRVSESTSGALAAIAPCQDREHAEELVDRLSAMASLAFQLLMSGRRSDSGSPQAVDPKSASSVQKVAEFTSETQLAFAITNKLRMRDGCELVALASVIGTSVNILSISGLDEISKKSPGVRALTEAMEEAVDLGQPLVNQVGGQVDESIILTNSPLNRHWHETSGKAPVAAIPLYASEKCVAVLCVRRGPSSPFSTDDIDELRELVDPYTGGLEMVRRANRSFLSHLRSSSASWLRGLLGRGSWGRKACVAATLGFLAWFFFGSMNYRLTVDCKMAPAEMRTMAAPFDAVLLRSLRMPGELVRSGDVLCEFDTRELSLEANRLESELRILDVEVSRALADDSPVDLKLARANRRQTEANLELVRFKIDSSVMRAPHTGTILKGDLRDRIGDAIPKGTVLFEVAGQTEWKLELRIPEESLSDVEIGQAGVFASRSRPDLTHIFTLTRLEPSAERIGGKNVFSADAKAEIQEEWMRSGMEGLAKIDVGQRAPWWVLLHGVRDSLRVNLWL